MNRKLLGIATASAALVLTLGIAASPASATPVADLWYTTTGADGWVEVNSANTGGVGNCPVNGDSCGTFNGTGSFTNTATPPNSSSPGDGLFSINVTVHTNSPGTPVQANTSNVSFDIKDNHTDGFTHDIWFVAGGAGFTNPLGNTLKDTNAGTTIIGNAGGSITALACIRLDNQVSNAASCDSAGNLPDFITPAVTGAIPAGPSNSWNLPSSEFNPVNMASSLPTGYSLIDQLQFTLVNGSEITFNSNATVFPTPEPASLAIFGTALLGFGLIRRRRNS